MTTERRDISRAGRNLPAIQWGVIAGILERGGGRRVVMSSDPTSIAANTMVGEKAFLVPGLWPMHDIWNHKTWIIWQGEKAVIDGTRGECGACRACCITPFIADEGDGFTKPSHRACANLCNNGCAIYDKRPKVCARFRCLWLRSQDGNRPWPAELRPDRCGAVATWEDETIKLHVDQSYPKSAALEKFVAERSAEGERFEQVTHYHGETR